METTKAQSEEIKDLLARQWEAYAQVTTVILKRIGFLEEQFKVPDVQQQLPRQDHIHRHSFDIKSSKVFSFVVGIGVICALSLWGNIGQWQSKRQYADDALKFRAIRSWGGCQCQ